MSGLAFVAYHHPTQFGILSVPLTLVAIALFLGVFVFEAGFLTGTNTMWPFIDAAKISAAQTASKAKEPSVGIWIFCIALFSGYVSLLVFLGPFLKKKSTDDGSQKT
ncbi:MAG TPA: hypothetical protein VGI60_00005 [Chthoniobacterales bacterium]